jgi:hypothetical protein
MFQEGIRHRVHIGQRVRVGHRGGVKSVQKVGPSLKELQVTDMHVTYIGEDATIKNT